tara:strand:+ start:1155 stop:1343 length:189 start_codon:yes stop_codon:yes gene_type:complete
MEKTSGERTNMYVTYNVVIAVAVIKFVYSFSSLFGRRSNTMSMHSTIDKNKSFLFLFISVLI